MAGRGQSSDPSQPNFSPAGIRLVDGLIEVVERDDPLSGLGYRNAGKIKLYGWLGPDYIIDPETYFAGCRKRVRDGPQVTRTQPCGIAFAKDGRKDRRH
jgi:hypothetical protein